MTKRALLRVLERERLAFQEERRHLIDVICHLAGKDWTPPPEPPPLGDADDADDDLTVTDPSQQFDFAAADFGELA